MSRFKRPVAGIMAALLLHSAVLPSSLFAATADIPEVPVAPTYVLELLRPDGSVEQTMARGWSEPLLARADRLHGIDAVAIDSLRKELEGIASQAKVGGSMIPTMLRILDALSAPSSEEYHRRIASLPVSISEVESIRDGQLGITKTFSARGVVRARTFRPHSSVRSDDSAVKCS